MTAAVVSIEVSAAATPVQMYGWASTDDAVEMIAEDASMRLNVSIVGGPDTVTYTVDTASQVDASLLRWLVRCVIISANASQMLARTITESWYVLGMAVLVHCVGAWSGVEC